jgi:hypothetical protein
VMNQCVIRAIEALNCDDQVHSYIPSKYFTNNHQPS